MLYIFISELKLNNLGTILKIPTPDRVYKIVSLGRKIQDPL